MAEVRRLQRLELMNDAINSQPDNLALKVRFAEDLLREGYAKEAVELLMLVLKEAPGHPPAHLALAAHYEKQGNNDLAAKHRRLAGLGR